MASSTLPVFPKGKRLGDTTYKMHLDGYDPTPMLTGKGPSRRLEVFCFGESALGAVRIDDYKYRFIDQPGGWLRRPPFLAFARRDIA